MPRIPTLDDLGARPVPRSNRSVVSVRNAGAVADAVGNLGGKIAGIGQGMLEKQDKLVYAAAQGRVLADDMAARQELADDPDYATALPRYQERMKKSRDAASGLIKNNSDRGLFNTEIESLIARGSVQMGGIVREKQRGAKRVVIDNDLDSRHDVGMAALDEDTKVATISGAVSIIQGAVEQGVLTPEEGEERRKRWVSTYNVSQVSGMLANDDIAGAKKYFDRTREMIDPASVITLENRLKSALDFRESVTDWERANSLPEIGQKGGTGQPVADGVTAIRALFPKAQVTSGYRGPDHPLSKANPKSWHSQSHAAVDIAPIKGMTFDQYIKSIQDAGYQVIEAKNEVGAGRSAHATGDHWHVVLGKGGGVQQGARRWDMESAFANVDALADREGWPLERRERVKEQGMRRISRDETLLKRDETEAERQANEIALGLGDEFRSTSQIPVALWNQMSVEARERYTKAAKANSQQEKVKPNGVDMWRLHALMYGRPDDFRDLNLGEFLGKVTSAEMDSLISEQAKLRAGGASYRSDISAAINLYSTMAPDLAKNLDPKKHPEQFARVFGDMERTIRDITKGARQPTDDELKGAFNRATMHVLVPGTFYGTNEVRRFDLEPGQTYQVSVPNTVRQRIINAYRQVNGTEPPDGLVGSIYTKYKGKEGYW